MKTYLRHKLELLQIDIKIAEHLMQKETWQEINDTEAVNYYQKQVNRLEQQKETYLNLLLKSLQRAELTLQNGAELKLCYELIEQYSKTHYSALFRTHFYKTIEQHQKCYGDFIIRNQYRKANEVEKMIEDLERII